MSSGAAKSNDILLLSYYVKLGTFFGLIHGNFVKKVWLWKCLVCTVYTIIFLLLIHCLIAWNNWVTHATFLSKLFIFVANVNVAAELCLLVIDLYVVTKYKSNWSRFWKNIQLFEEGMAQNSIPLSSDFGFWSHILVSVLSYAVQTGLAILEFFTGFGFDEVSNYIIPSVTLVINTQMVFLSIFMYEICGILSRRYDHLNSVINFVFEKPSAELVVIKSKVREVGRMHVVLHNIVKQINIIFGKHITFMVFFTSFNILLVCEVIQTTSLLASGPLRILLAYDLLLCIYTIVMIMSCDKVEKSGVRLLKTCLYLQATAENNIIENELLDLSICMKQLLPKFSAAGFFDINQRLIPAFLSGVTAYIIILIQLRA